MKSKAVCVFLIALFCLSAILAAPQSAMAASKIEGVPGIDYINNKIVITVQPGIDIAPFEHYKSPVSISPEIDKTIAAVDVINIEPFYPHIIKHEVIRDIVGRMFIVTLGERGNVATAVDAFGLNKQIETADPYYIYHINYVPNDPLIAGWYQLSRIDSYGAWDYIRGDSTSHPILGIVDSGVYYDHPELEPNMWINTAEDIDGDGRFTDADINGIDDDYDDYVDDVVGYDIAMNDPYPYEPTPTHGTHVAGCATMACDNNYGGAATGWSARIMAVKAALDNDPTSIYAGFQGIIYAADRGCSVINLSWGRAGNYAGGEQSVINAAYNAGVVVVAAAGNESSSVPHWPAGYEHVVSVVATDVNDHVANFSNYGDWVDICAPGVSVYSTWSHNSFTALDGTSMASPVTAGVVCLMRAADTSQTVDQIVARLLATADTIDSLNPGYEGLLGAGRVNAAKAIGLGRLPRIRLGTYSITLTVDDGDSLLNPGERFNLAIDLNNEWNNASNVTGILQSDSQFVVADSMANFGDIAGNGGSGNNSSNPFDVIVDGNASIGTHQFKLIVSTGNGPHFEFTFNVSITLEQRGFPGNVSGSIDSPPLVFDFNNDGRKEILVSASDMQFYAFEPDGSQATGWPQPVSAEAPGGAAVGDIDGDGVNEVVGMARDGNIYAWHPNGSLVTGFPHSCGSLMFGTPVLGDIDGDSHLEIMIGGFISRQFYVLRSDGTNYPGWPFQGAGNFYGTAAVADIDNDSLPEIICGDYDSTLYVWNANATNVPGFPVMLSGTVKNAPSVADIDGDGNLNIVIGTSSGDVYAFNNNGSAVPGWPVRLGSSTYSAPALADIDLDGHLEIIIGCNDSRLYVLNADGQAQAGFPVGVDGAISASPVVGDIDGDGFPDIAFGTTSGLIYAIDLSGQIMRNFPIAATAQGQIVASSALVDLDGDGDCEIITGVRTGGYNLEVIDYKAHLPEEIFPWPSFGKDIHRSSYYGAFITGINDSPVIPDHFIVDQNYPNPFNGTTLIRFALPHDSNVDFAVFDLLGRRIRSLHLGKMTAGYHEITWNGLDDHGTSAPSGVYFYRINSLELNMTRKMVLIK